MRLESSIQTEFLKKLKKRDNSVTYKHHPIPTGIPDIHHIESGRSFWIEVKRASSYKPSPLQYKRHELLRAAGAIVIVAWEWEQVETMLKEHL